MEDIWLARSDGAGNQLWSFRYETGASDLTYGLTRDGVGGVYLCGFTRGSLGGPNAGMEDAWLARFDGRGAMLWLRQIGSHLQDYLWSATSDGVGGVIACGSKRGNLGGTTPGHYDAWITRYDSLGNELWTRQFGTPSEERADSIAADGVGGVYVSGQTNGNLGGSNAGVTDAWVARYDALGNQVWMIQTGTEGFDGAAVAGDGQEGLFVAGTGGPINGGSSPNELWFAHHGGTGRRDWARRFGTDQYDTIYQASLDGSGGAFVSGFTFGDLADPNAGNQGIWIRHYDILASNSSCDPPILNSAGVHGTLTVTGSNVTSANAVLLDGTQLPHGSFGMFMASKTLGAATTPGGSQGTLCLSGSIGRFDAPGQVQASRGGGTQSLEVDITAIPLAMGNVGVSAGETWSFQLWYRDRNPMSTSHLTNAVSVLFR